MVTPGAPTREALWAAVGAVLDPEVPVLSVVDLGIVRDLRVNGDHVEVDVTPTYSGCPAMRAIEHDIVAALEDAGVPEGHVTVRTVFQPAWTTDWISADARERLRAYGIAPPRAKAASDATSEELIPLRRRVEPVECPYCRSMRTERQSEFGATACKAIWVCESCRGVFEEFKAL